MKEITFEDRTYKLKPNANADEFPAAGSRLQQLCWLSANTYPKGFQREKARVGGFQLK
jgi:hypothetical protein